MAEKQQTLILLTPGFAKDEKDDFIPVLQLFVKNLKKLYPGLHVIVLALQYPYLRDDYELHGARVISFNGFHKRRLSRLLLWGQVWITLSRLVRRHRVMGLLSFWFGEGALLGTYFGRLHRLKQYAWFMGQDARAGNKLLSWVRPKADNLIVLSDALAAEVYRNYALKPRHRVPFGVDPSIFPGEPGLRNIDIMGAGSLIPLKRYHLFLDVIQSLVKVFPALKVVLCGQGPEKDGLRLRIAAAQLQDTVTLMDEVPHAQVLALMQQSRVFLHTSSYEGFAAVCAEALYAGAQVVSFCQPIHQPIPQWHIVDSKEALLHKLLGLLDDKNLAHERVLPFTMKEACGRIMALFGYQRQNNGS